MHTKQQIEKYAIAALIAYIGIFLFTVAVIFVCPPYGDLYDWISHYFEAKSRNDHLIYLWDKHAEHHLVWMRLITALDIELFRGQSYIFVAVALASVTSTYAMLRAFIAKEIKETSINTLWAWIIPMPLFLSVNAFGVGVHINTTYIISIVFSVAAIIISSDKKMGTSKEILIILLFSLSVLGSGLGFAVLPVLLVDQWSRKRKFITPYSLALALVFFVYFFDHLKISLNLQATNDFSFQNSVFKRILYFFDFLVLPFSATSPKRFPFPPFVQNLLQLIGPFMGFVIFSLIVRNLKFKYLMKEDGETVTSRLERVSTNLILFSCFIGIMIALTRHNIEEDLYVPIRYTIMLAPLQIGFLLMLVTKAQSDHGFQKLVEFCRKNLIIITVTILLIQALGSIVLYLHHVKLINNLKLFNQGIHTPDVMNYVYFSYSDKLDYVIKLSSEINDQNLYSSYLCKCQIN